MNSPLAKSMADVTPRASALIESLRDIGYSLETALADVIDNSLTAGARNIEVLADTLSSEPSISIRDDGRGMDQGALVEAMRPGSRNPREERDPMDLGRFGLGLKSASFSQCRRLTVWSRQEGVLSGARWDLDDVAASDRWSISILNGENTSAGAKLLPSDGTLVIWEKLDRVDGGGRLTPRRRPTRSMRRFHERSAGYGSFSIASWSEVAVARFPCL